MTDVRITHIGGPTALIEVGGWRLLTDPTFDPPGRQVPLRLGDRVAQAGRARRSPPPTSGRSTRCCSRTTTTTTTSTPPGARCSRRRASSSPRCRAPKRLGGGARGLENWATTRLEAAGRAPIEVTATPCRHGPPRSHPIVGDVIGFALRWEGQEHGVLWISGDTVLYDGVREVAEPAAVDTALLHLGGVQFPVTGPLRYTMTADDAVELCGSCGRAPRSRSTTRAGSTSGRAATAIERELRGRARGVPRARPLAADRGPDRHRRLTRSPCLLECGTECGRAAAARQRGARQRAQQREGGRRHHRGREAVGERLRGRVAAGGGEDRER